MLSFILPLFFTVFAGGLLKRLFLARSSFAGMYFNAITGTILLVMIISVTLAVFRARPSLAPVFSFLSMLLIIAGFYAVESMSFISLVLLGVFTITLTTWLLASLGCALRQRLHQMD